MMKRKPTLKPLRPRDAKRTELLTRLCTVLLRASAQKEGDAVRAIIIRAALSGARVDYQETGNPIHLLNGFLTATRAGVPIPRWVIDPMAAAVEMFIAGKGKITLNDALCFTPSKGERSRWTQAEQHEADARAKWLFDQQLKVGRPLASDNAKTPNAVEAVATVLGHDSDQHDSLRQTYHKRLKKHSSRLSQ